MISLVLPMHAVIVCTLFMLLIHLHLMQVRDLTITNTLLLAIGALTWPVVLTYLIYRGYIQPDAKQRRLAQGLSDGRWRSFMGKANTDYEIDGDAFKQYEQEQLRRERHKAAQQQHAAAH